MALVIRGIRAYEYRSVRRGGKVTSEYVGGGMPAEYAEYFRRKAEGVRLASEAGRAAWEAERGRLAEAERRSIEADASYDELATLAMLATGHHRPQRGRWRRRRPMANQVEAKAGGPPLVGEAEMADLIDRIDRAEGDEQQSLRERACDGIELLLTCAREGDKRALPALLVVLARRPGYFGKMGIGDFANKAMAMSSAGSKDVFLREVHVREIESVRDELAGSTSGPLERLLCERVALAWFDSHQREISFVETTMGTGCSIEKAEYYSRQRDRAFARFLAAAKALATVRRLAMPVLHVHRDENPPVPVAATERLRVLADGSN